MPSDILLLARLLALLALTYGLYLALKNSDWLARLVGEDIAVVLRRWRRPLR